MQVSKISLALCVFALGVTPVIRATDTPAQASARAALASKLFEISAETPVTNKASAAQVKTQMVAPAAAPAVKTVVAPVVVPVVKPVVKATEPVMVPMDKKAKADAEKKAAELKAGKEAAYEKQTKISADAKKQLAKLKAEEAAQEKAAAAAQAKAKAKAEKLAAEAKVKMDAEKSIADAKAKKLAEKQAAEQKAAEVAAAKKQVKSNLSQPKTSTTVKTMDTLEQAKAREAIAHSLFQDAANSSSAPATKPAVSASAAMPTVKAEAKPMKAEKPTVAEKPKVTAPVQPVAPAIVSMAPPLPINSIQQHKLAELLTKYKADMVTPDEYQKLRAAILANP